MNSTELKTLQSNKSQKLRNRIKKLAKEGKKLNISTPMLLPPPPPDLRTREEKIRDKAIEKKKAEEEAEKLIQEGRDSIFNLSFDKQDWEHAWNLEEYEKDRIERYENEFPRDESYEGVAQWCICYKCRPDWHSQPGGVIYIAKEESRQQFESYKMFKEDSEREKKRLKLKEQKLNQMKIEKRRLKEQEKQKKKEEDEKKRKLELDKKLKEQLPLQGHSGSAAEMEYRKFMIEQKDLEKIKIYETKGWKKNISKRTGRIYWSNSKTNENKWDHEMNIKYDEWMEFYSYTNEKSYWYNHKTKERTWVDPNS